MTRRPPRNDDRGLTIVLMSLFLVALLVMASIAVDLGSVMVERRRDQNVADASVTSAAVQLIASGGKLQDAVDEILEKVDTDLGRTLTTADWTGCSDSESLPRTAALQGLAPATDCISFSAGFDQIRVKLPDQQTGAVFGSVVGITEYTTTAAAIAGLSPGAFANPPFIALSTAGAGDEICLRTGGSNSSQPLNLMQGNGPGVAPTGTGPADPCNDSMFPRDSSNFGTLLPYGYTSGCRQRELEKELAMARGIDHVLGVYDPPYPTPGGEVRVDGAASCTTPFPNTFDVDTGFSAQGLRCAMISLRNGPNADACNGVTPRLWGGATPPQTVHTVVGEKVDNLPLWDFLRPAAELAAFPNPAPARCVELASNTADPTWDFYDKKDALMDCLRTWDPSTKPQLFTLDLGEAARFAFIPQIAESTLRTSVIHVNGFLPAYMHRMYISDNNATMCHPLDGRPTGWLVHEAGMQTSCGAANQNIDKLAGVVLACAMLPDELCDEETGIPPDASRDIFNVQLID